MKDKKLEKHLLLIHAVTHRINKWEYEWANATSDAKLDLSHEKCKFERRRLEVLLSELGRM